MRPGLEAQVVNIADELAYNAHDLDDGLRSGHFAAHDIAEVPLIADLMARLEIDPRAFTNQDRYLLIRKLLGLAIEDTVTHTHRALELAAVGSIEDVRKAPEKLVSCSPELGLKLSGLKRFLYQNSTSTTASSG